VHITAAIFAGIKPVTTGEPRQVDNLWRAAEVLNDAQFAGLRQGAGPRVDIRLPK
jgi:hypothetical protein